MGGAVEGSNSSSASPAISAAQASQRAFAVNRWGQYAAAEKRSHADHGQHGKRDGGAGPFAQDEGQFVGGAFVGQCRAQVRGVGVASAARGPVRPDQIGGEDECDDGDGVEDGGEPTPTAPPTRR